MEFVTNDKLMFATLIHAGESFRNLADQIRSLQNVCGQLNSGFNQFAAFFVVVQGGWRSIWLICDVILLAPIVLVEIGFDEPSNAVHLVEAHLNNAGLCVFSRIAMVVSTYYRKAVHRVYTMVTIKHATYFVPHSRVHDAGRTIIEHPSFNLCASWNAACNVNSIVGLEDKFTPVRNNVASQSRHDLIKWAHHTQAIYYRRVRIGADMP